MRIRSIKPEFWRSQDISRLDVEDRLLFIGLWSYVDDNGVGEDRVPMIAADLFADDIERDPSETFARVSRGLANLSEGGQIVRYAVDGRDYFEVLRWKEHQRIDKPGKSRLPHHDAAGSVIATPSRHSRDILAPGTGNREQGTGDQGTEEQGNRNPPNPPRGETSSKRGTRLEDDWIPSPELIDQMRSECPGVNLEAEHRIFVDYWIAQPGQKGVKVDWEATWRNWMRRKQGDTRTRPVPPQSRADEAQSFIQRLEAIDATRGSGEATGNHQELR